MKKLLTLFTLMILLSAVTINAQDSSDVTFQVDMGYHSSQGNFDPAADTVVVIGGFNQWTLATSVVMDTVGSDVDTIYTATIKMPVDSTYEYKFNIGQGGWNDETNNRSITVPATDTVLPVVYWNDVDPNALAPTINVVFSVDMSVRIQEGFFNPASDVVSLPGAFNNWNAAAQMKVHPDNDSIWVDTLEIEENFSGDYKFNVGLVWEGKDEKNNRTLTVGTTDTVLPTVFFDNDSVVNLTATGNVTFTVHIGVLWEAGLYDPAVDTLWVQGDFNNWNTDNPDDSKMERSPTNDSLWFITVDFVDKPIGQAYFYKYKTQWTGDNPSPTDPDWQDGWERPVIIGGNNRSFEYEGTTNEQVIVDNYDQVNPEWFFPTGTNMQVTWRVDMSPAVAENGFDKTTDSVFLRLGEPAWAATQDLDADANSLKLLDPDGDMIYEVTYDVKAPTWNTFVYTYGFVDAQGNETNEGDGGLGAQESGRRVRFVGQTDARTFDPARNPWVFRTDTWEEAVPAGGRIVEVDPYDTYSVDVKDLNPASAPAAYELNQNYPNPFNPTTTIRFSIPEAGLTILKVYNVLGQEVATLVNEELTQGVKEVQFDASNIASGIYFYTITSGDFVQTKKMVLLK